ncbi:NIPSNAP family protein [Acinetobacter sp. MB5]|uniref:NIPSNAP family protein n=1 Tax=Acinetobacter sp. MB5 TaxID=2069438 RepID=UPI000DD04C88|nr:NIPSNAP family protein [Acinetobacter sp. MB5]
MIYELRSYFFSYENWDTYKELFFDKCLPIRKDDYGILKGKWICKLDHQVIFFHLWQYDSLDHRQALREQLGARDDWKNDFIQYAPALLDNQFLKVLNPIAADFDFKQNLNLFTIDCMPGTLKEVLGLIDPEMGQFNTQEFPNPNELKVFSVENNLLIHHSKHIKNITNYELVYLEA